MSETIVKKRVPKVKPVEKKVNKLPTEGSCVSPALFEQIKISTRQYDAKFIQDEIAKEGKKWSDPVVRNFLKTGYCTDPELSNFVVRLFIKRFNEETALAGELATAKEANIDFMMELINKKEAEFITAFQRLKELAAKPTGN